MRRSPRQAKVSSNNETSHRTHRNRKWGIEYKKLLHNRCIINIKNLRMTLPKGGGALRPSLNPPLNCLAYFGFCINYT